MDKIFVSIEAIYCFVRKMKSTCARNIIFSAQKQISLQIFYIRIIVFFLSVTSVQKSMTPINWRAVCIRIYCFEIIFYELEYHDPKGDRIQFQFFIYLFFIFHFSERRKSDRMILIVTQNMWMWKITGEIFTDLLYPNVIQKLEKKILNVKAYVINKIT